MFLTSFRIVAKVQKILIRCQKSSLFALFFLSSCVYGLEMKPWLGDFLEFQFQTAYTYSNYSKVNNACRQLSSTSNDQFLDFRLVLPAWPTISVDMELEFADTPRQPFGYRTYAVQARYEFLDDIEGDPVSLVASFNYRNVSSTSLHDVSAPYHAKNNYEVNVSIGKEWDQRAWWIYRVFGFFALGIANKGSPWTTGLVSFEGNIADQHRWRVYMDSYIGYGAQKDVNIECFDGYASIQHRSVDLGAGYSYILGIWGKLSLDYERRVYAHSFPQNVNFLTVSYCLPFTVF